MRQASVLNLWVVQSALFHFRLAIAVAACIDQSVVNRVVLSSASYPVGVAIIKIPENKTALDDVSRLT